jgi:hypothetical protein
VIHAAVDLHCDQYFCLRIYGNYLNANPSVEPAGMLILDDVHLLEGAADYALCH